MLYLAKIAISACREKEAQLTTSERLQVQKENALTERAR